MVKKNLIKLLKKAKLKDTDTVMIHVDTAFATQFKNKKPKNKINYLIKILTEYFKKGIILIPTFSYSFTKNEVFDPINTKSDVGIFSEIFRKKKNVFRTNHPNFSFAIKGDHAKNYLKCKIDDAFGKRTVFDLFKKRNGKIICLGCDFNRITYVHHVEQLFGVKYRYLKNFYGKILIKKKIRYINSKYFVRKIKIVKETDLKLLKNKTSANKSLFEAEFGRLPFYCIEAKEFYNNSIQLLKRNKYSLIKK